MKKSEFISKDEHLFTEKNSWTMIREKRWEYFLKDTALSQIGGMDQAYAVIGGHKIVWI